MNQKFEEFKKELTTKRVAVIGAGVSNLPLIKLLNELGTDLVVFDKKTFEEMEEETCKYLQEAGIRVSLGEEYLKELVGFEVIFRSPSFLPTNPYLVAEVERGAYLTTEVEQVIRLAPGKVIGITGSKGKTTTTTILYNFLKEMGYSVYLGGNIGYPLFCELGKMTSDDLVVLELSSFQLMGMRVSPDVAVITNISPDHLDIHGSYSEYIEAKKFIFKNQEADKVVVLNADDEVVRGFVSEVPSLVRWFKNTDLDEGINQDLDDIRNNYVLENGFICYSGKRVIDTSKLRLKGCHNYLNMCAALNAIKEEINVTDDRLEEIAIEIKSVEHRLEFVREINGVSWYNDSASTTPDKASGGLYAFDQDIVLIAGGYDKNISYEEFAKPILEKVSKLILFGSTKTKIYEAVMKLENETGKMIPIYVLDTLEEVVEAAYQVSVAGEVVLFSPASASFDMFKNAYQRGDLFKDLVKKL